jgi:hypothetical protein
MADLTVVAAACALFAFTQGNPDQTFVFRTCDPAVIDHARALLKSDRPGRMHPTGTVTAGAVAYNPQWHYHLDEASVSLAEMSIEVCDADMAYVEAHLADVGGAFLPGGHWCPWNAVLTGEVDPETGKVTP